MAKTERTLMEDTLFLLLHEAEEQEYTDGRLTETACAVACNLRRIVEAGCLEHKYAAYKQEQAHC